MRFRSVAAVLAGLVLAGVTPLAAQTPKAVTEMIAAWETAFNSGDGAAVAAFYTEDAVRMPPGAPMIEGQEAIMTDVGSYAGMSLELTASGGMLGEKVGVSWGEYALSGEVEGQAVSQKGLWMNALKKTEAGWKIYRDTWNIAAPETESE